MRALLLVLLLVVACGLAQGQKPSEYREQRLSGKVVGYRLTVDFISIFGTFALPPNDFLLVELNPEFSHKSEHPYILVRLPKPLSSGKQFADGEIRSFKVWRWVGCDDLVQRTNMKILGGLGSKELPDDLWVPCYVSKNPIRDKK